MSGSPLERAVVRLRARPRFQRIAAVAAIGLVASWITYEIVFLLMPLEPRATLSWTVAFTIAVLRQHHLHRSISFPGTTVPYRTSLLRDAGANVAIAVSSATLNWLLTAYVGLHHRLAWALCMILVATSSYCAMSLFVFRGNDLPHQNPE